MNDPEVKELLEKIAKQMLKLDAAYSETSLFIALADLEGMARAAQWRLNDLKFKR